MKVSRRDFLRAGSAAAAIGFLPGNAFAQAKGKGGGRPIKLGSLVDASGNLDIYGKPMVQATQLAVEELNAAGGLLGRKIQLIQYDSQSNIATYAKFAQQLVRQDKVDVVHGAITSASREAIRPIFHRGNTLYFYNVLYEGGVCDRNIVCTGTTPAQANEPLVDLAMKQWGKRMYIIAADYNYGQITSKWLTHYVKQRQGTVVKAEFFPLTIADFGSTIAKIQQEKPDWVCSALIGGAHMSFYRQWAASGMNKRIPLASTVFGGGNEHQALSAAEGDGILVTANYSPEDPNPANKAFLAAWQKRFGDTKVIHELAVSQYQGIKLWAEAVKKAGTLERNAMLKAIESEPSIEGPAGTVKLDAKTHHCVLDVRVLEVKGQKLTIKSVAKQRPPADTAQVCDLIKNPKENKQFEISV